MTEEYLLQDPDNRDEDGAPLVLRASLLAEFIPYVDGPLRSDTHERGLEHVDSAIDYLRRERFDLAEQELRKVGVYISLEAVNND